MNNKAIDFDRLFNPASIAIVGASPELKRDRLPFLQGLIKSKYPGSIYPINPKYKEIMGIKSYPSLMDVFGDIDLAIIMVPAQKCINILEDCVKKKVRFAHVVSSGFSELGEKSLQENMVKIGREGGTRIIGPNCLGIYCSRSKITFFNGQPITELGNVGYISQSGGHTLNFYDLGRTKGFSFNKIVSIGNQADLTIQDFIGYFGKDRHIKVICAYIEDIKEGRNFLTILKQVTRRKPVIIWRGGITSVGAKATYTHTGALGLSTKIWHSVAKQIGIISVDSLEELADDTLTSLLLPLPKSRRVGICAIGGGNSVELVDVCTSNGLEVPFLDKKSIEKIKKYISEVNTNMKNPVDLGLLGYATGVYSKVLSIIAHDRNIDSIVTYHAIERLSNYEVHRGNFGLTQEILRGLSQVRAEIKKPLICVVPRISEDDLEMVSKRNKFIKELHTHHIPTFPTITRGTKTLLRLERYRQYLEGFHECSSKSNNP